MSEKIGYWNDISRRIRSFVQRNLFGSATIGLLIVGFAAQCYICIFLSMKLPSVQVVGSKLILGLLPDVRFAIGFAVSILLFMLEFLFYFDYDDFKERQKNE